MIFEDVDDFLGGGRVVLADRMPVVVLQDPLVPGDVIRSRSLLDILEEWRIQVPDPGREAPFPNLAADPRGLLVGPALEVMSRRQETSKVPLGRFRSLATEDSSISPACLKS